MQRYYDPAIGRFLSVDPIRSSTRSGANFNRFGYARNNSYRNVDHDGRYTCTKELTAAQCAQIGKAAAQITQAKNQTKNLLMRARLGQVANLIGTEGDGNGIEIANLSDPTKGGSWKSFEGGGTIAINFRKMDTAGGGDNERSNRLIASVLSHEGWHGVQERQDHLSGVRDIFSRGWIKDGEIKASQVQGGLAEGLNYDDPYGLWTRSGGYDIDKIEEQAERSTNMYCFENGCYD